MKLDWIIPVVVALLSVGCGSQRPRSSSLAALWDGEASSWEREALQEFDAIANKADMGMLDDVIERYPGSKAATMAFTMRYNLTQHYASLGKYHDFIARYRDTAASQLAVFELFQLYRYIGTVAGFLEFIEYYAGAPQSVIAKLEIHKRLFKFLQVIASEPSFSVEEKIDAATDFIVANPLAAQSGAAETIALTLAAEAEEAKRQEIIAQANAEGTTPVERAQLRAIYLSERSNGLATDAELAWEGLDRALQRNGISDRTLPSTVPEIVRGRQVAARIGHVVRTVYRDQEAAARIRAEIRHQDVMAALESIHQAIRDGNAALVQVLHEEFQKTRDSLQEGFGLVSHQLDGVNRRLDVLHSDMTVVTQQLSSINDEIRHVTTAVQDVHLAVQRTNELVAIQIDKTERLTFVMNENMSMIYSGIQAMNEDMNRNFDAQNQVFTGAINELSAEVRDGFQLMHSSNQELLAETRATRVELGSQLSQMNSTLDSGFTMINQNFERAAALEVALHREAMLSDQATRETINVGVQSINNEQIRTRNQLTVEMKSGFGMLREGLDNSTATLERAIFRDGDMTRNSLNNVGTRIVSSIETQGDRMIQRLDRIDHHIVDGDNRLVAEMQGFRQDFNEVGATLIATSVMGAGIAAANGQSGNTEMTPSAVATTIFQSLDPEGRDPFILAAQNDPYAAQMAGVGPACDFVSGAAAECRELDRVASEARDVYVPIAAYGNSEVFDTYASAMLGL